MENKKMPIGLDSFADIITHNFYYVDKTDMIRELLENWGKVNLFTRPRRFGKSLNMSMLRSFFEIGTDKHLFDGLAISKETKLCEEYMGQYPVISLTLKDVSGKDFQTAVSGLWAVVSMEANRLNMIYDLQNSNKLDDVDKSLLTGMRTKTGDLAGSLNVLSYLLKKHCGKNCIVLIDEYDVPLQKAEAGNYYRDMVGLISAFFSSGMKSNDNIFFAVVTGCLKITKESIFTGFNNPKIHTLVDEQYDEWFGFTDSEVREMLTLYDRSDFYNITKEWYDGYLFGNVKVYCPWDVINWCEQLVKTTDRVPRNFWENTSGNDMILRFAQMADSDTRDEIGILIDGGVIKKSIRFDITYDELDDNIENLWSVLFSTGYLTQRGREADGRYALAIPNREVTDIFKKKIKKAEARVHYGSEICREEIRAGDWCPGGSETDRTPEI
ncbi:MAG: AAA family ATPase [Lachnospiraceae bacterium]|nr:AAA family ATPase [Lachnospiraceae bacterium]